MQAAVALLPLPPSITWNYILILEWLSPSDIPTGKRLFDWLKQNHTHVPAKYVQCSCPTDVRDALQAATLAVPTEGTPILHIEAHGSDAGIAGDPACASGFISWKELGVEMRSLNIATQFDLLLVSAACKGLSGIFSFENALASPFNAIVGFVTKVGARSLLDAIVEFYRCLITRRLDVFDAVAQANLQLHSPSTEMIHVTPVGRLVFDVIQKVVASNLVEPGRTRVAVDRANLAIQKNSSIAFEFAFEAALRSAHASTVKHLSAAWERWFAFAEVPHNGIRLAIDMNGLVSELTGKNTRGAVSAAP